MNVFITGATGFIGRALTLRLLRDGHTLTAWVRDESNARSKLGADVHLVPSSAGEPALRAGITRSDAVVNLAGEPLIGRWTAKRRRQIIASRVDLTQQLVQAMQAAESPPATLVSGSAVGYYGDRGDETLTEDSAPGSGFLSELCRDWEQAALQAEVLGTRVVTLRTGIVLGREGGALARLLPPFRFGLGGRIGSGRQYMPWIHLHDHVEMITAALTDARYSGAVNATASEPATNAEFTRHLGRALHRPAVMPLPAVVLKAALGEASSVLLTGQRAIPHKATSLGFDFQFPHLADALADIIGERQHVDIGIAARA
jgi:uncharacterized protein (TIGR01777 family)